MTLDLIIGFLAVSVIFYTVFGGADFGTGILEVFAGRLRDDVRTITKLALGPVWEANHIWLIIAVVILFNGFPPAYAKISTIFHIPLTLMLVGIVIRGCAFTFRHYDKANESTRWWYSTLFVVGSLLTPVMYGLTVGGLMLGRVSDSAQGFVAVYVSPWATLFGAAMGLFVVTIFGFLAAVFCVGEVRNHRSQLQFPEPVQRYFRRWVARSSVVMMVAGLAVFGAASWNGVDLLADFLDTPLSGGLLVLATVSVIGAVILTFDRRVMLPRICAAVGVGSVVIGWMALKYPYLLVTQTGGMTFSQAAAPTSTLHGLLAALVGGSVLIFPCLYFLFKVFKLR
ncbi:cytochrome d ubiquinol oxidase subunit II [bacterium]|nr:cytochrome d ubiquinol oxidase subunit II [bacterium]